MHYICRNGQKNDLHRLVLWNLITHYTTLRISIGLCFLAFIAGIVSSWEKKLDLCLAPRLKTGWHFWEQTDLTYRAYQKYVRSLNLENVHKSQFGSYHENTLEMCVIGSRSKLEKAELIQAEKAFRQISYQARQLVKYKPNLMLDLNIDMSVVNRNLSLKKHHIETRYEKALFKGITLTSTEQQYIEYLIFNTSHKGIAYKHNCSETAVRKVITNIKRKLGNDSMSTQAMMTHLNEIGLFNVISQKFTN